jgi:iron(III) transport system ATP-binding protein
MPDIELRRVLKRFGTQTAVNGIDLAAEQGEMLTLLGPSGCGKTTTLRMIAGLEDPDEGTIRAGERLLFDAAKGVNIPPENRGLGMVFQSYAIWPHMTVLENVAYPLKMRRVPVRERRIMVSKVLDLVGLGGLEDKPATKLSGGQQQRVAFARALVFQPELLLLDEPLSNLDAKLREHMRFELRIMQKRLGLTAICVTHDQEEALTLSDRLVVMNGGNIEQVGTPEEIYERPATRFVAQFIGKANMIELDEAVQHDAGGATVRLRTYGEPVQMVVPPSAVRADGNGRVTSSGNGERPCLFIRPEKIAMLDESASLAEDGRWLIPGTVRERAYAGDHNEYLADVNERIRLRVIAPAGQNWPVGASVRLGVAPADVVLYR